MSFNGFELPAAGTNLAIQLLVATDGDVTTVYGEIKMMKKMMKKMMMSAVLAASVISGIGVAAADTCKNVQIRVNNDFVQDESVIQIKMIDFDYWDNTEGKWREEAFLANPIILPGTSYSFKRDLSFVGGESGVVIRVQFQYLTAHNGWSETLDATSEAFTCNSNQSSFRDVDVEGV